MSHTHSSKPPHPQQRPLLPTSHSHHPQSHSHPAHHSQYHQHQQRSLGSSLLSTMLIKGSSVLTSWRRAAFSSQFCILLLLILLVLFTLHYATLLSPHIPVAFISSPQDINIYQNSLVPHPTPPSTFCSHKAYLPSTHRSSLAPSFPPPTGTVSLFASPVLLSAMTAFLSNGITCFDIDVFSTADNVLMVGHPTDTQAFLSSGRPAAPVSVAASATGLYVETLLSTTIRTMDPLSYIMTLDELLAALPAVQSSTGVTIEMITLEPKGKLNNEAGIETIINHFNQPSHEHLRTRINMLVSVATIATTLRKLHPWLQTGLPLRDRGVEQDSSAAIVCDPHRPIADRLATLAPYSWVWPSDRSVERCGAVLDGGEDLIQRVRREGKKVGVWVVDEAGVAERVWNKTDRIMSNLPFEVRADMERRRGHLSAQSIKQDGLPADSVAGRTVSVS